MSFHSVMFSYFCMGNELSSQTPSIKRCCSSCMLAIKASLSAENEPRNRYCGQGWASSLLTLSPNVSIVPRCVNKIWRTASAKWSTSTTYRSWQLTSSTICLEPTYLSWTTILGSLNSHALLPTMTSTETICHLCSMFAWHGILDELRTDKESQFTSKEFLQFMQGTNILHTTSSPLFPQPNGMAEQAVKTVKHLFKLSADPYTALLVDRASPFKNGYSPSQLLFGCQLKKAVPITIEQRRPKLPDTLKVVQNEVLLKNCQKRNFHDHHSSRPLSLLPLRTLFQITKKLGRSCLHQAITLTLFPLLVENFDEINSTLIHCPRTLTTFRTNLQKLTHPTQHL